MPDKVAQTVPKVSIVCITYNQEAYIKEALESFVMQKTNFPFEVIVGEDCSTDRTRQIVQEYAEKNPEIIKPIYQKENTGGRKNFVDAMNAATGEYFVINEGDDFFTDKNKLQIQSDFMDKHPECSMCFHRVKVFFQDKSKRDYLFPALKKMIRYGKNLGYDTLKSDNYIQTNSCMYRKDKKDFAQILPADVLPGDWFIHLYYSRLGKIGFINRVMSAYRKHPSGIWYLPTKDSLDVHYLKYGIPIINFAYQASKVFNDDKEYWLKKSISLFDEVALSYLKNREWEKLKQLKNIFPDLAVRCNENWKIEKLNRKVQKYKNVNNKLIIALLVIFLLFILCV